MADGGGTANLPTCHQLATGVGKFAPCRWLPEPARWRPRVARRQPSPPRHTFRGAPARTPLGAGRPRRAPPRLSSPEGLIAGPLTLTGARDDFIGEIRAQLRRRRRHAAIESAADRPLAGVG